MYKNTITVFNYHKKSGYWYPSVISGADLLESASSNHTTGGTNNTDTVSAIIHCTAGRVVRTQSGFKDYVSPKEYARSEDPGRLITFKPERDFIYAGAWSDTSPINDDEYDESLYNALNEEYDGVYRISSVAFYGMLPHFEIGGR